MDAPIRRPATAGVRLEGGRPLSAAGRQQLRRATGQFATGVTVVTFALGDGTRRGFTANSFTSVSLDPPLVLVSLGRTTRSHDEMAGLRFCINVLGAEQESLATHFAGRGGAEPAWAVDSGVPRLADSLTYFRCAPWAAHEAGDHTIFVGRVEAFGWRDGDALAFFRSRFTAIEEENLGMEFLF